MLQNSLESSNNEVCVMVKIIGKKIKVNVVVNIEICTYLIRKNEGKTKQRSAVLLIELVVKLNVVLIDLQVGFEINNGEGLTWFK
jgi:hypothetical protein